jgi:hypothetical protein
MAALHETAEPVRAEGMRGVVAFHGLTAAARPGVAKGTECADSHANAGGVLEGSVAQAKGGGVGGPGCGSVRLAEKVEGRVVQVIGVLLEVRAGGCRWDDAGRVLES